MRSTRSTPPLLLALALLPGCAQQSAAPDSLARFANGLAGIRATCAEAKGQVEVRRKGSSRWEPVGTGGVFQTGDEVRTAAASFARVELVSSGRLELEENSSVLVEVAAPPPAQAGGPPPSPEQQEDRVKVGAGVVRGYLPESKTATSSIAMVIDPGDGAPVRLAAESGKKKVAFRLTRGEKKTELAVTQGAVRLVADGGSRAQALKSGQAVDVSSSGISEPSDLIGFPQSLEPGIDARFHYTPKLVIGLAWRELAGATGYRVQVATDLSFQTPEAAADVSGTDYALTPRGPGLHAWRVAARDVRGRYGEWGFARRIFCEQEQPKDLLVGPENGAVVRFSEAVSPRIAFSWESAATARSYRLVVASGTNLMQQKVLSLVSSGQRIDVDGLIPGEYYWGVYVDDEQSPVPIFVKPRKLVIQKVGGARMKVPKSISEWGR